MKTLKPFLVATFALIALMAIHPSRTFAQACNKCVFPAMTNSCSVTCNSDPCYSDVKAAHRITGSYGGKTCEALYKALEDGPPFIYEKDDIRAYLVGTVCNSRFIFEITPNFWHTKWYPAIYVTTTPGAYGLARSFPATLLNAIDADYDNIDHYEFYWMKGRPGCPIDYNDLIISVVKNGGTAEYYDLSAPPNTVGQVERIIKEGAILFQPGPIRMKGIQYKNKRVLK